MLVKVYRPIVILNSRGEPRLLKEMLVNGMIVKEEDKPYSMWRWLEEFIISDPRFGFGEQDARDPLQTMRYRRQLKKSFELARSENLPEAGCVGCGTAAFPHTHACETEAVHAVQRVVKKPGREWDYQIVGQLDEFAEAFMTATSD